MTQRLSWELGSTRSSDPSRKTQGEKGRQGLNSSNKRSPSSRGHRAFSTQSPILEMEIAFEQGRTGRRRWWLFYSEDLLMRDEPFQVYHCSCLPSTQYPPPASNTHEGVHSTHFEGLRLEGLRWRLSSMVVGEPTSVVIGAHPLPS